MHKIIYIWFLIFISATSGAAQTELAQWVELQREDHPAPNTAVYSKTFNIDFDVTEAYLKFTCLTPADFGGTHYRAYVNNVRGPEGSFVQDVQLMNVSQVLRNGDNTVDIEVKWVQNGYSGPILAKLWAKGVDKDGNEQSVVIRSDETWTYTIGEFSVQGKTQPKQGKKVVVVAPVDSYHAVKAPLVMPKINTNKVVGVTDVVIKGGNAGSLYQFNLVRDYSDKFYFLDAMGYSSIEDYIFGQSNYQNPGLWFWGYDKTICRNQEMAGYDFTVYPWVWVPAEWYREKHKPDMVKCIEHGEEGFALSLWSDKLLQFNEEIYSELKKNFGDSIRFIYPGIYGDFGEAHYMAGWNPWLHPKPDHAHPDFWAGDDLAKADFRKEMSEKYESLDALNKAWGTGYTETSQIAYPALDGSANRRHTLDFVNWYYDSMTRFTKEVCAVAKKHFPNTPVAPKLGCGDENPMWGQDNTAIPEELAKIGVDIRSTHGTSPNFAVRRISSACKFYGNRFETETASGTNRNDATKKFFIDASSGCAEVFEYPNAIIQVADIFSDIRRHLRGEHSITETALFFPTSWHRANLKKGYPPRLPDAAEELRDMMDFDVVDENMVLDGALKNYRLLALFDGNFTEQAVYDKLWKWVEDGGTLFIIGDQLPFKNVEGEKLPISDYADNETTVADIGKGKLYVWHNNWDNRQEYYELIHDSAFFISDVIDGKRDNVWISLFKNKALFLNNTSEPVQLSVSISEETAHRLGLVYKPQYLNATIEIPANSCRAHFFDRPFIEYAIECEEMDGAEKHPVEVIYREGYGTPGKTVKLPPDNYLRAVLTITEEAEYGFYCIADPSVAPAELQINNRTVGKIKGGDGPHKFKYPMVAKVHLKPGKYAIKLSCGTGTCAADKIIITTDTELAGFTYGFINPEVDQNW